MPVLRRRFVLSALFLGATVTCVARADLPVNPGADIAGLPTYRSAFSNYRPYADEPVASWQKANDLVGRIGGWKAYAREAQADEKAPAVGGKAPPAEPQEAIGAPATQSPAAAPRTTP